MGSDWPSDARTARAISEKDTDGQAMARLPRAVLGAEPSETESTHSLVWLFSAPPQYLYQMYQIRANGKYCTKLWT
jgi:hypothetical protein